MTEAKIKIRDYVNAYQTTFTEEMKAFKEAHKVRVINQKDKYSKVEGSDIVERKLGEIPETLYTILQLRLEPDEFQWFGSTVGTLWFYKTFPEFSETKI